jgi:hypothetical protein
MEGHRARHGREEGVPIKVPYEDAAMGMRGGGGRDGNVGSYVEVAGVLSGTFLLCDPLELGTDEGNGRR